MCLGPKTVRTVAKDKVNPYKMYKLLEERYTTKTPASRVQLQTELHQLKCGPGQTISEFVDKMEGIFNQLEAAGGPVLESLKGPTILAMFGNVDESPYAPVVSALQTLADDKLTWEAVTTPFLLEYTSRNRGSVGPSSSGGTIGGHSRPRALRSMAKVRCLGCNQFCHY